MTYAYLLTVENTFAHPFCVYVHEVAGEVIYVGEGSLPRAFTTSDRTDAWRAAVAGRPVRVGIICWCETKAQALADERRAIAYWQPRANFYKVAGAKGHSRGKVGRPVRCVQTGIVYPSGRAAAKALGLTQGAVSNVVVGRYKSVRGLQFERVTET